MSEPVDDTDEAGQAGDADPAEPEDEEQRCKPHGNRLPCPMCLADEYGIWVWNSA